MIRLVNLYFHTLYHLKFIQIWARLTRRFFRTQAEVGELLKPQSFSGDFKTPAARRHSMIEEGKFRFLNQEGEIKSDTDWNDKRFSKLWLYNLHYFDDFDLKLVEKWIEQNPPGYGVGWEPYPSSLRIVNWIKWSLSGNELSDKALESLCTQVRYLLKNLEYHILGNHIFANAKALCFAGCFFYGSESRQWLAKGLDILKKEIPEQILSDGGHFERSTMYQSLVFEDMLDLSNLSRMYPESFDASTWSSLIKKMGEWLQAMSHPDGEISFFNDASTAIAPKPQELLAYAKRLGFEVSNRSSGLFWAKDSGYVKAQKAEAYLLVDVAPIGPDYLPGHAHADTLSFELSLGEQRIIVNSGTSEYEIGERRNWERSTAAHSTVEVDGKSSSQVWAGFRVAKRAYPLNVSVEESEESYRIEGSHDGYKRISNGPIHSRQWLLSEERLVVEDRLKGTYEKAVGRFYLHPDVSIHLRDGMMKGGSFICGKINLDWSCEGAISSVREYYYAPEFGRLLRAQCLELEAEKETFTFVLNWHNNSVQNFLKA